MHLVRLLVKVKAVDRPVVIHRIPLFLWHDFSVENNEFVDASDVVVFGEFFVYLATMSFINSYVLYRGVVEVGSLLQAREYIRNNPILWDEYVV